MNVKICRNCGLEIHKISKWSYKQFEEKLYCSKKCRAIKTGFRGKPWNTGLPKEKQPCWGKDFGGLKNVEKHNGMKYYYWRKGVLERDGFKCKICGSLDKLVAHHVYSFSRFPEYRYLIVNGITLCIGCHKNICVCDKYRESHGLQRHI